MKRKKAKPLIAWAIICRNGVVESAISERYFIYSRKDVLPIIQNGYRIARVRITEI